MKALYAKMPVHSSWLIATASVAIVAGVAVAHISIYSFVGGVPILVFASLITLLCIIRQRLWVMPILIIAGFGVGYVRGTVAAQSLEVYKSLYGTIVALKGTVTDDVTVDKQSNQTLQLANLVINGKAYPGKVWVSTSSNAVIHRSDTVIVSGVMMQGFGTFSGVVYRASLQRTKRPSPHDVALEARDWFSAHVRQAVPEPQASLGVGYLVGQRSSLPEDLDMALKTAGLTHIVVASGYNLTILVRLARRLFEKVSKYLAVLVSTGLIACFVGVTGLSPSMSRAGLVTGLGLLAWYYGRTFHPLVLLSLAAAVTVLINPSYAWGDVGWLLSFAAFGGVMILAPLLHAYYFGDTKPGMLRQILGETISAGIMTAPILMVTYGYVSNVAIPANLLILPLVPLAMLLTFIAGIGSIIFGGLASFVGIPAYVLLSYMTQTAHFFADVSWAKSEVTLTVSAAILVYTGIIAAMLYMWWRTKLSLSATNVIE